MHFAQRGGHDLDVRKFFHGLVNHRVKRRRVELGFAFHVLAFDAETFLQILLVADQHVHVLHDAAQHLQRLGLAAPDVPKLLAIIQVKRRDRARALAAFMASTMSSPVVSDSAAKMPPLWNQRTPLPKISVPIEIAGLELAGGLVAAVVKNHRRAHALAAVGINRGHVRPAHAVVLELFVERFHAHCADALGNQIADGIIHHRAGDAGVEAEAVRQICGDVEFAAADVDVAMRRLAERDDARVEPVDQRAEREKIKRAGGFDVQAVFHF